MADSLTGTVTVLEGDTLGLHGQHIRLHGIDGPGRRALCLEADGLEWRCGEEAADALADKIGRQIVTCLQIGTDTRWNRLTAVCSIEGEELNRWLVAEGWAMADREHADDYLAEEVMARADERGVWRGGSAASWRPGPPQERTREHE